MLVRLIRISGIVGCSVSGLGVASLALLSVLSGRHGICETAIVTCFGFLALLAGLAGLALLAISAALATTSTSAASASCDPDRLSLSDRIIGLGVCAVPCTFTTLVFFHELASGPLAGGPRQESRQVLAGLPWALMTSLTLFFVSNELLSFHALDAQRSACTGGRGRL